MNYNQKSFAGGLNTVVHDSQVNQNEYPWLINGRNRFGRIDPVPKHVKLANAPSGKKQGIRAVGNITVLFVAGRAYYQVFGSAGWVQIPDFLMNAHVDLYYTLAVPASELNFQRKAASSINQPIVLTTDFKVSGTPAAIIVQDTINQPWLIIFDPLNNIFTARVSKNYAQWQDVSNSADDREYVPIGRQMMYLNGKTFIVSRDKKKIYQSITGRPLDFMMNVDTDGNKAPSELNGGADTTSFAFDSDDITCIQEINIPDSFVYGTAHNVRLLTLDYNNTIFGEPRAKTTAKISAGIVNQDSWVDLVGVGDYAFVDFEGIISFNAVQTFKFNGKNSLFSLQLSKLFHKIRQKNPICILFNNYAIFNVDTVWGNVMAVYDIVRNQADQAASKWTAIDITEITEVKQFTIIETSDQSILYCITAHNEVWQMFSDEEEVYTVSLKTRAHTEGETDMEHKATFLRPMFQTDGTTTGDCRVMEMVDDQLSNEPFSQPILNTVSGVSYPVQPPVIPNTNTHIDNPSYNLKDGLMGKKISYVLTWNVKASLIEYKFTSQTKQGMASTKQTNQTLSV